MNKIVLTIKTYKEQILSANGKSTKSSKLTELHWTAKRSGDSDIWQDEHKQVFKHAAWISELSFCFCVALLTERTAKNNCHIGKVDSLTIVW